MDNLENNFVTKILSTLKVRLGRELNKDEIEAFSISRSYMAYEMILDGLNDDSKSQSEISNYVENVIKEYKTTANNGYKA